MPTSRACLSSKKTSRRRSWRTPHSAARSSDILSCCSRSPDCGTSNSAETDVKVHLHPMRRRSISWNSTTPTPTPASTRTSSRGSSPTRPTRATGFISVESWTTRRHSCDDPREDVSEDVGVGVVECELYKTVLMACVLIVASVIQTFHLTPYAVARSLASQQMGEDEQGQFHITLLTAFTYTAGLNLRLLSECNEHNI